MFLYDKILVEFNLVQHQISFTGSSDVRLSFTSPNIDHLSASLVPAKKSDVGLCFIQQVFIIVLLC